ncbi:hypothetical protein Mapa_015135 [Marchantia paleacea]|nr:hypothetical protein Mapa_015135 [Marchantia paleacea]
MEIRLKKPSGAPGYLVQLYKDLKLANPVTNRKSIRVQQEMLTSAMELVQASNKNKPSEELLDSVVQLTLGTVDEAPSSPEATNSESGTTSDGGATATFEDQPKHGERDDQGRMNMLAGSDVNPPEAESTGK